MLEDNKKVITVSFLIVAVILGFLTQVLLGFMAAHFAFFEQMRSQVWFSNGVPVLVAGVLFASLQFNKAACDFADDVVTELKKVVWPPGRDTVIMTIVVIITLLISGVLVGLYDAFWAWVINSVVS